MRFHYYYFFYDFIDFWTLDKFLDNQLLDNAERFTTQACEATAESSAFPVPVACVM